MTLYPMEKEGGEGRGAAGLWEGRRDPNWLSLGAVLSMEGVLGGDGLRSIVSGMAKLTTFGGRKA